MLTVRNVLKGDNAMDESAVLEQLKRWLQAGATIKATDTGKPVLVVSGGVCDGNLTVTFPKEAGNHV